MINKNNLRRAVRPAVVTATLGAVIAGALLASPLASISATPVGVEKNGGARLVTSDQTEVIKSEIKSGRAKNVILLIGDGMGDSEITSARDYQYGAGGRLPGIDALPLTGQYTTYSLQKGTTKPDYVPDSAATGTAWSTGTKTYDNAISVDTYGKSQKTLLELAKEAGLKTGDVTTSELQDATPAVEVSHISARSCYGPVATSATCASEALENGGPGSITEQLINTRPDVTLGGGKTTFIESAKAGAYAGKTLLQQATERGYNIVQNKDQLAALTSANQTSPVLGLFAAGNMPVRWGTIPAVAQGANAAAQSCQPNSARPDSQPTLAAMTSKAIELLQGDKGFFLQVEGASIDKQDHSADACGQIGETIDLDEAVQVALKFAKEKGDTMVVVTADHAHTSQIVDTTPPGSTLSVNLLTTEGSEMKISYGTAALGGSQQHTGTQLRVAAYGPSAANFVGLTDQSDMFFTIRNALALPGAQALAEPTVVAPTATPSASAAPSAPSVLAATTVPFISGALKVGGTLSTTPGVWNVAGIAPTYQWLRDGAAIAGATGANYVVTSADAGKAISVRVIATKAGSASGTSFSASTTAVPRVAAKISTSLTGKKLTIKVTGAPSVTGSVSVYRGSTVIAHDVSVKGGKAVVSVSKLGKGKTTVKVVYAGSSQLLPKAVNVKLSVK